MTMTADRRGRYVDLMTSGRQGAGAILADLEQLYIDLDSDDPLERQVAATVAGARSAARRLQAELGAVRDDLGRMARR